MSVDAGDRLVNDVRLSIYRTIVDRGTAPTAFELAAASGAAVEAVEDALRALADGHVIILTPEGDAIWGAPPFAAVPTAFRVTAGPRHWFAPCAWDAFGIPAAAEVDADIHARCAWDGKPIACGVRGGEVYGDGVVHLLVPAAHFWDNIRDT